VLLALMTVACGGHGEAADHGTALITGTVRAGPVTPIGGETLPLPRATIQALRAGVVVAHACTDASGKYQLRLPPSTYLTRAAAAGKLHSKEPGKTVTVSAGETLTVSFILDTGIR